MKPFLICIFCVSNFQVYAREYCTDVSKTRSGAADYYITGLFPIYNTAPSRYNTNGLQYTEIVKYTLNKFNRISPYTIGYEFFDTCGEAQLDITTEIVTDMIIGKPFNLTTDDHSFRINGIENQMCKCENSTHNSNQLGVVGPASSSVSIRTSNFLSHEQLLLISYASTSPSLSDKTVFPNFMRTIPSDTYQVQAIIDLIVKFNWTYISIIASDNSYGRSGTNELLEYFKRRNICIGKQLLFGLPYDNDEIKKAVYTLAKDKKAEVIIVFALSTPTKMIFKQATELALHNRTWILTEAAFGVGQWITRLDENVISGAFGIQPFTGIYHEFEDYFWKLSYSDANSNPFLQTFFNKNGINQSNSANVTLNDFKSSFKGDKIGNARNAVVAFIVALEKYIDDTCSKTNCSVPPPITNRQYFNEKYLKSVQFKGLLNETISFDANGDITTALFVIKNMQGKGSSQVFHVVGKWTQRDRLSIDKSTIVWSTKSKPKSRCSDTCGPGFYALFDQSKPCCWDCLRCPDGQIKLGYGERNNCTFCPESSVPDNNGAGCIHIEFVSFRLDSTKGATLVALSSLGIILSMMVLYIFIKFQTSIIVRSANRKLSIIQVILHMLLFSSLLLFFLETTTVTCSIQLYTMGCLLSIILSIILIKTEVLLRIFKCKSIMNKTYARITATLEVIIVASIVIVYAVINLVLYLIDQRVIIAEFVNYTDKTLTISCHFDTHLVAIFIFLIIVALFCGIQAYRARKLPDVFNEGNFIMYAVFISSLNMVLILLLTQYGQDPAEKTFILFILVLTTNSSILIIMYGYKVFMVCFHPDSNRRPKFSTTFVDTMKNIQFQSRSDYTEDTSIVETVDC